jgi:hypothetical protein
MVFGVKPPGSSLFSASDEVPRREVEIRTRQTWVGNAVEALMEAMFMYQEVSQVTGNAS